QLLDPEGRLRSRALRPALPLSREARINTLRGAPTLETVGLTTGEQARLLTMPVVRGGRIVDLVQVAMPLRRTHQTLLRYVETLVVLVSSIEEVDQLIRLAEDLLLLSRSTVGLSAPRQAVDLEPFCLEALELGVRLAKGKGVNVSMGATAPAVVQGDAGALRRALLN